MPFGMAIYYWSAHVAEEAFEARQLMTADDDGMAQPRPQQVLLWPQWFEDSKKLYLEGKMTAEEWRKQYVCEFVAQPTRTLTWDEIDAVHTYIANKHDVEPPLPMDRNFI